MNNDERFLVCNFFKYARTKVADSFYCGEEKPNLSDLMYDYRNELENDLETEDKIEIDVDKVYEYLKSLI